MPRLQGALHSGRGAAHGRVPLLLTPEQDYESAVQGHREACEDHGSQKGNGNGVANDFWTQVEQQRSTKSPPPSACPRPVGDDFIDSTI
eukprot:CAMPEP_0118996992 /NCGR_PEP_ID=MMETSP1173-20130426/61036_1 /TAXON_ID=1034831 /ORGANISM="Rhizochromulina marina cf, Strain CCMP1243" /LENGTH=88 /DNA_ID=CAMNT_0006948405 /DNA_START=137 /DNA_END=403 /DNA_ORIENTATION=-